MNDLVVCGKVAEEGEDSVLGGEGAGVMGCQVIAGDLVDGFLEAKLGDAVVLLAEEMFAQVVERHAGGVFFRFLNGGDLGGLFALQGFGGEKRVDEAFAGEGEELGQVHTEAEAGEDGGVVAGGEVDFSAQRLEGAVEVEGVLFGRCL